RSYRTYFTPLWSSDSIAVRTGGSVAIVGSVTTSASVAPISFRSMPTSRVTPAPNRTLEAAISNAKSFFIGWSLIYLGRNHLDAERAQTLNAGEGLTAQPVDVVVTDSDVTGVRIVVSTRQ